MNSIVTLNPVLESQVIAKYVRNPKVFLSNWLWDKEEEMRKITTLTIHTRAVLLATSHLYVAITCKTSLIDGTISYIRQ